MTPYFAAAGGIVVGAVVGGLVGAFLSRHKASEPPRRTRFPLALFKANRTSIP